MEANVANRPTDVDVLVVGAGPTGLTLAAQLNTFGVRFRLIDRALDRAHESRALAVQARSLEILQYLGLGDALVARGNGTASITLHVEGQVAAEIQLSDFGATDTRYPFILFVSQADTEALLASHLTTHGVVIERGVELQDFAEDASGVTCTLRFQDGRAERVRTKYLVGCDGAHSTVRKGAGIAFEGDAYLQDFMLGDVEADSSAGAALAPNSIQPFVTGAGIAVFFPLGHPTTWRIIAMSGAAAASTRREAGNIEKPLSVPLELAELQAAVSAATGGTIRLRDPAWLAHFHLHHRQATHYRRGRAFVAGDAGHIHSPVGGQGMNTGIQDAWNLGWKLALVAQGQAPDMLLDSYEAERWPVGRTLLRYTDRIFSLLVRSLSTGAFTSWLRRNVAGHILPGVLRSKPFRTFAFRFVSELNIRYRRSPLVLEGKPKLRAGPKAGDRLPDGRVERDGRTSWLQAETARPCFHLLLCGAPESWDQSHLETIKARWAGMVAVHYVARSAAAGVLVDTDGEVFRRLGIVDTAYYLVRPDGYIGFRAGASDLTALIDYLGVWLTDRESRTASDRRTL